MALLLSPTGFLECSKKVESYNRRCYEGWVSQRFLREVTVFFSAGLYRLRRYWIKFIRGDDSGRGEAEKSKLEKRLNRELNPELKKKIKKKLKKLDKDQIVWEWWLKDIKPPGKKV